MKRNLALAAVDALVAAPIAHAIAADAMAPAATTTTTTSTTTTAPAASNDVTLADGSKVTIMTSDMSVWTVDATTGAKAAKADGEYKLADGTTLKVVSGKAVGTPPAAK